MKVYYKKEFQLIKSEIGEEFAAIKSDDLFIKMNKEIENGESELIQA